LFIVTTGSKGDMNGTDSCVNDSAVEMATPTPALSTHIHRSHTAPLEDLFRYKKSCE